MNNLSGKIDIVFNDLDTKIKNCNSNIEYMFDIEDYDGMFIIMNAVFFEGIVNITTTLNDEDNDNMVSICNGVYRLSENSICVSVIEFPYMLLHSNVNEYKVSIMDSINGVLDKI